MTPIRPSQTFASGEFRLSELPPDIVDAPPEAATAAAAGYGSTARAAEAVDHPVFRLGELPPDLGDGPPVAEQQAFAPSTPAYGRAAGSTGAPAGEEPVAPARAGSAVGPAISVLAASAPAAAGPVTGAPAGPVTSAPAGPATGAPAGPMTDAPAGPVTGAPAVSGAGGLRLKDPGYDDSAIPALARQLAPPASLVREEMYRIVRQVVVPDSGEDLYAATNTDAAYPATDPARRHGLHFGLALFTQASGRLGSVLRLFANRDPAAFEGVFGAAADELLTVTNAGTPEMRLHPVGGEDLSSPGWLDRFRRAGGIDPCRYAQNEEAVANQFEPMLPLALALGLDTPRALAFAYDRVVVRGLSGGLSWVAGNCGVLSQEAERAKALQALGYATLLDFQAAQGLAPREQFDLPTRAALALAARQTAAVPLPDAARICRTLAEVALGPARERLRRLLELSALTDIPYE